MTASNKDETGGSRDSLETNLARVNYLLGRFRTPRQWERAVLEWKGRPPTKDEWGEYKECLKWLADMRVHIKRLMVEGQSADARS